MAPGKNSNLWSPQQYIVQFRFKNEKEKNGIVHSFINSFIQLLFIHPYLQRPLSFNKGHDEFLGPF